MAFVPGYLPFRRRHPSRSQSATAEPVYPPASLQNGNPETGVHHDQSRRLLNQHRPDRRLYARPRAPVFQAFPSIHLERSTVPVPRPPIRNVSVPHGFHQDPQTSTTLGSSQRDSSYRLPRRLAYRGQGPSYFAPSHSARSSQANRSRIFSQTQQVFPDAIPVHPTPRFYDPHNRSNTVSSQGQGSGSPSGSLSPVVFPNVLSPFPRFFHRQGPVHDKGDLSSPSEDSSSLSRQEPGPETVEIMDFSALSISNSQGGTNMVERTVTRLERSDFPSLPFHVQVLTDASDSGWGIVEGHRSCSGQWTTAEQQLHINQKELLTIWKALQLHRWTGSTIRILCDNNTAIAYVNKFGGTRSPLLLEIAQKI